MKLKTTFFSMLICLMVLSFSASAQWCGTSANGKYQWRIETKTSPTAQLVVTVHPLTLANSTFINFYPETLFGGGFGLTKSGTDWVFTQNGTYTSGAELKFHFLYNGDGIGGQEQSESLSYAIGQNCSASNIPPVVDITGFINSNGLVSPETIAITATATDADGSVTKVEFYNGTTKIGETTAANANGNQYTFVWINVQPGNHSITAKAIDDKFGATTSSAFPFTVTGEFTQEWCGISVNGDYQWKAETTGTSVKYTLHPAKTVTTATPYAIIYPYGVGMTRVAGTNDFTYTATGLGNGTNVALYFTYNYYNGENNSSANKESYTVGNKCAATTLPVSLIDFKSKVQADGTVSLNWSTASETNNNHFVVQKSVDNKSFITLADIPSKGTISQNRLNYSFIDKNPTNGTNYYKLSQVDNNGAVLDLGIVAENISLSNTLSQVYPNPLQGNQLNLSLVNQADGQVSVSIISPAGQVIYNEVSKVIGGQVSIILVSKPAPGFYVVKAGDKSFKLVIQ